MAEKVRRQVVASDEWYAEVKPIVKCVIHQLFSQTPY